VPVCQEHLFHPRPVRNPPGSDSETPGLSVLMLPGLRNGQRTVAQVQDSKTDHQALCRKQRRHRLRTWQLRWQFPRRRQLGLLRLMTPSTVLSSLAIKRRTNQMRLKQRQMMHVTLLIQQAQMKLLMQQARMLLLMQQAQMLPLMQQPRMLQLKQQVKTRTKSVPMMVRKVQATPPMLQLMQQPMARPICQSHQEEKPHEAVQKASQQHRRAPSLLNPTPRKQ
jgi:hypothetical protein